MKAILKFIILFIFGFLLLYFADKYLFNNKYNALITVIYILSAFFYVVIKICLKVRRVGGSMMTVTTGAMDAFYNKDQKNAIEIVLEKKIGNRTEGPSSFDPPEKP